MDVNLSEFIQYPNPINKTNWIGQNLETRLKSFQSCFIGHPEVKQIIKYAIEKIDINSMTGRSDGMLVVGESGSGKTVLTKFIEELAIKKYGFTHPEKTIVPVLNFQLPDPCTPVEVCIALLSALGDNRPRYGAKPEIFLRAKKLLKQCQVRLVLIDNFHDAPTKRGLRNMGLVSGRIRDLMDASNALWIFLGTRDAVKVRNSDPQIVKRIPYLHALEYFSITTQHKSKIFKRLIYELEKWIPLAGQSCLTDFRMLGNIYIATEGILDRLFRLVEHAIANAVNDGREDLLRSDLENAFTFLLGPTENKSNPFSSEFTVRRLTEPGEPFEVLRGPT